MTEGTIRCEHCGAETPNEQATCVNCGEPLSPVQSPEHDPVVESIPEPVIPQTAPLDNIDTTQSAAEPLNAAPPPGRRKTFSPAVTGCLGVAAVVVLAVVIWIAWTAIAFFHEPATTSSTQSPTSTVAPSTTAPTGTGIAYSVTDIAGGSQADRDSMDGKTITVKGVALESTSTGYNIGDSSSTDKPLHVQTSGPAPVSGTKVTITGKYSAKTDTITATDVVKSP
ncbi:MAG TPA: zinc ribbon domain-containing protein [Capsulimonadaceae bacterium]|jgi:cytoskeletal protein RodZ